MNLPRLDEETRAKLDASHVVICILPSDEKVVVRGQDLLKEPAGKGPGTVVMTCMRVPSQTAAELVQLLLQQRPSPPLPSGWPATAKSTPSVAGPASAPER